MSDKKIIITNANNFQKFVSFKINGLEDGILVGLTNKYPNCISISYKDELKIVPFSANTEDINELNSDENAIKPSRLKESNKITTSLSMDKETYDWLTTSNEDDDIGYWQPDQVTELDDEAFDAFEKDIMNPEPDMERVEAAKKIFEGVDKVINDIKIEKIVETPVNTKTNSLKNQEEFNDLWKNEQTHYREPHFLELLDEWGVNSTNYADFRSVIQEHCFNKGLYAFDDIERTWKEHQKSLKNVVESIKKNGNN